MSNLDEADTCVLDTQETYYEGAIESLKISETQSTSLNESQDFNLAVSEGDDSMVDRTKQTQDGEANPQKSVEQAIPQQIPDAPRTADSNAVISKDKENEAVAADKKDEAVEKTPVDVSGEQCESEKKDDLFDEDEVIQGTPPQDFSPSRKGNVASLKRKAKAVDEPLAKMSRTTSAEDTTNVKGQLEEEEEGSRQSCDSDDSYQDLFKNIDKNVIIEETQDPTNLEFTQNPLKPPVECAAETTDDETREQTKQRHDEASSEKCRDVEKDENVTKPTDPGVNDRPGGVSYNGNELEDNLPVEAKGNVAPTSAAIADENLNAKLTDPSANDGNVKNGNDSQQGDDLSVEGKGDVAATSAAVAEENPNVSDKLIDSGTDANYNGNDSQEDSLSVTMKGDDASTSVVIAETSGIGTLDETESVKDTETISDKNNEVEQCVEKATEKTVDDDEEIPSSQTKSRISVELIFEGANRAAGDSDGRSKPQVVQIDDDGEKILDSSADMMYDRQSTKEKKPEVVEIDDSREDDEKVIRVSLGKSEMKIVDKSSYDSKSTSYDLSYKSVESVKESSLDSKLTDKKLMNGSTESKNDTDMTLSLESLGSFSVSDVIAPTHDKLIKKTDNIDLISVSDNDTSNVEEKNKPDLSYNPLAKTVQVEREIGMYLKFKCLLHVDENTKETVSKELTAVQCEPIIVDPRQKNEDSQGSLADISDNKDSSPGSVTSHPQLYQLNPSRLSIMSSISSSSSASSAASLQAKLARNAHFFPTGLVKHAKKSSQDILSSIADKHSQTWIETYDYREWKNHHLLTTTILNCANTELGNTTATTSTAVVNVENVSHERLDDHLIKSDIRSSTPSDVQPMTSSKMEVTPRSTKKGKPVKRPRSKLAKSNAAQINGENGADKIPVKPILRTPTSTTETDTPLRKRSKIDSTLDISDGKIIELGSNSVTLSALNSDLLGKNVFAKWTDKTYYSGTVSSWLKGKYKVNFYDGQTKVLIPEFVIPIPKTLREGLSVYATTKTDYDGVCGIIVDVQTSGDDDTYYTVETDDGERLRVQLPNIFLSADQAQVLKEEMDSIGKSSLPSTPKALAQVTLDNVIDGKRRSKRLGTPLFSTPKSKSTAATAKTNLSASTIDSEASGSGISAKKNKKKGALSEIEGMSSDSNNVESILPQEEYALRGVQREIIGMPYGQKDVKGPLNRIKSKPRSKKKRDDPQMIEDLGPIPSSKIFKGMSFIFTCASLETLDRYLDMLSAKEATETETETETEDVETENEDGWVDVPFVRERLHAQILAGGGMIYMMGLDLKDLEDFPQIPKDEYKNTTLITNVPNVTAKSILCLSAGISVCNHKWIIRCCQEGKTVRAADYALPNGWSLQKKTYIDAFQTARKKKALSEVVIIIPSVAFDREYVTFWRQVCENAGAVVLIAENSGAMETMDDFDSNNIVVVSNRRCPPWALSKANRLMTPVLSTTWVAQCIIEGKLCPHDQHPRYRYNYKPN